MDLSNQIRQGLPYCPDAQVQNKQCHNDEDKIAEQDIGGVFHDVHVPKGEKRGRLKKAASQEERIEAADLFPLSPVAAPA